MSFSETDHHAQPAGFICELDGWASGGILPPVSFSETDHHAQPAGFICELRDRRFQALTGWIEP